MSTPETMVTTLLDNANHLTETWQCTLFDKIEAQFLKSYKDCGAAWIQREERFLEKGRGEGKEVYPPPYSFIEYQRSEEEKNLVC